MHKVEEQLKPLMLQTVDFQIDGKSIKRGKIKVFNTKQFFIKFKLESMESVKDFELPYPFKITKLPNGYMFDYSLSAFVPKTEESYWRMRTMNRSEASKLYDNYLFVLTLSGA